MNFLHLDCHYLWCGAEIWHHVAYISSTYSNVRKHFDLTLLGSHNIATMSPTQHTTILCQNEHIYFSPMLEQISFHHGNE